MKLPLRGRLLLAAAVTPIVGCLMVGVSWKEWSVHRHLERSGVNTVGEVMRSEKKSGKRSSSYNLLVSYEVESHKVQGTFTAKRDLALHLPVGSQAQVVYDPKNERVAHLKGSLNSQEYQGLMVLGAGIFALGPILGLIAIRLSK